MSLQINTRADLDALKGTPAYLEAMQLLYGSLQMTADTAEYPEGYGAADYVGPAIEPVWTTLENLESIERLGFTKDSFLAEYEAATA